MFRPQPTPVRSLQDIAGQDRYLVRGGGINSNFHDKKDPLPPLHCISGKMFADIYFQRFSNNKQRQRTELESPIE